MYLFFFILTVQLLLPRRDEPPRRSDGEFPWNDDDAICVACRESLRGIIRGVLLANFISSIISVVDLSNADPFLSSS